MPIIKSAKKRVRIARKATVRNTRTKRTFRTAIKLFTTKATADSLQKAQSAIDHAVKKGVMHKNKAARKKSQLAAQAKASGLKHGAKKTTPSKKSSPAKKPVAKKTVAKKAPAKKTTKK